MKKLNLFRKMSRGSIRYKWTISFIIILIVPIVFNYVSFLFFLHNARETKDSQQILLYESIVEEANIKIQKYKKIGAELRLNETIQKISNFTEMSQINSEIAEDYKRAFSRYYIDLYGEYQTFIYFENSSVIGTMNEICSVDDYLNNYVASLELTIGEWKEWLSKSGNETLAVHGDENVLGKTPRYIAVKYTIYENRQDRPTNFVILIRDSYLNHLAQERGNSGTFYMDVLSERNELISTNIEDFDRTDIVPNIPNQRTSSFHIRQGGKRFRVSAIQSNENAWRYVFYMPQDVYNREINRLCLIFGLSILFIIITGLILIREIIGKQYSPVAKILSRMPKSNDEHPRNEYLEIENMVLESIERKRESERIMEKQKKTQTDNYMLMILNGIVDREDIIEKNIILPESFFSGYHSVVIFSMAQYVSLFKDEEMSDFERYSMLCDIIENIGTEILADNNIESYFMNNNGQVICLTKFGMQDECEALLNSLDEVIKKIDTYFSVSLVVCIGRAYLGKDAIAESYREALYCTDYIFSQENDNVIYYGDVEKESGRRVIFGVDEESLLNAYINAGESGKACELIEQLVNRQTGNFENSMQYNYYINGILSNLMRNFLQYINDGSEYVNNIYLLLMVRSVDHDKIMENFRMLISDICRKIANENSNFKDEQIRNELIIKVKEYISKNYSDPDLSVEQIAEHCDISVSYLSKLFRRETKDGLLNCINRMRIQKAKEILDTEDVKIEDVAREVGVMNVNTFIRIFKKYENITPGLYKKAQLHISQKN